MRGWLAALTVVCVVTGCAPSGAPVTSPTTSPALSPTTSAAASPTRGASGVAAWPEGAAIRRSLEAIVSASGASAISSISVRREGVEAYVARGRGAEQWVVRADGVPMRGVSADRTTHASALPPASFPVEALREMQSAVASCGGPYEMSVRLTPNNRPWASTRCGGGENWTWAAQSLDGTPLGPLSDALSIESLEALLREASAIGPAGRVARLDLMGRSAAPGSVAIVLPGYDTGQGYSCASGAWQRALAVSSNAALAGTCVAPEAAAGARSTLSGVGGDASAETFDPARVDARALADAVAAARRQLAATSPTSSSSPPSSAQSPPSLTEGVSVRGVDGGVVVEVQTTSSDGVRSVTIPVR